MPVKAIVDSFKKTDWHRKTIIVKEWIGLIDASEFPVKFSDTRNFRSFKIQYPVFGMQIL